MAWEEQRFEKAIEASNNIHEAESIFLQLDFSRLKGGYDFPEVVDKYLKSSKIILREAKKIERLING